ncbi:hypothetical protein [Flavobacterium alkalisoli]|uniref:hypothetical protein n=1 Tax=Flavobacterium alkalisoli TaxID=2602769 RepID=UPI003A9040C2
MKKLFLTLVCVFFVNLASNATECVNTHNEPNNSKTENVNQEEKKIVISIKIDFGRVSKDCKGFGVCDVTIDIDWNLDLSVISFGSARSTTGKFDLYLTPRGYEEVVRYFGKEAIVLEENLKLADDVCDKLGLSRGYTLKAGTYNLTRTSTVEGASHYVTL